MGESLQLVLLTLGLTIMVGKLVFSWWIFPYLAYRKLKANGFSGPQPSFPFGNLNDIKKLKMIASSLLLSASTHDIHSTAFPYFSLWQKLYGTHITQLIYYIYEFKIYRA